MNMETQNTPLSPHTEAVLNALSQLIHEDNKAKGFWDNPRTDIHCLMLIVTELSEAAEATRMCYPQSDKIPKYGLFEEELADAIIRILDLAGAHNVDIGGAVIEKLKYNRTRPRLHGKSA